VIEVGSTFKGVQDSTGVVLEDGLIGFDSYRGGALSDRCLECIRGVSFNFDEIVNFNLSLILVFVLTFSILRCVGVVFLLDGIVGFEVSECDFHRSTVASHVTAMRAINKLLLREAHEPTSCVEVSTFE